MMFDQIEKLKQDLTDKYVIVDANMPELMRFDGHVGQVKTVNMNGRALVQFEAWNNIGWYDIDVDCLKIVPKPAVRVEEKKHEAKREAAPKPAAKPSPAVGEKKLSPLEMARMQGAAKSSVASPKPAGDRTAGAAGAAKKSTADILAAARAAKAATAADGVEKPAAPKAKLSTADILATARAKKAADATVAAAAVEARPAVSAAAPTAVANSKPTAAKPVLPAGQRPSVPEILAWCRQHDAK
ncbi:MAG: hypothetical protein HY288_08995 [Planctomycetia bacterium]|nr:hypothetical protein [Planctomycetia bacterium]